MKDLIEKYNFNFKKKYGQNFLKDKNILENIALKSDIDKDTLVIEIGVGAAALTNVTSNYAKNVIVYEIDETLKPIINEVLRDKDNVEIIFTDFLKRNVKEDIKKYEYKKLYVVANLPYYISTPIIMKLLENRLDIDEIIVMVQKEVAERLTAKTGTRLAGAITYAVEYYSDATSIIKVPKESFVPSPKVESEVIKLKVRKGKKIQVKDEKLLFNIISKSFMQRRKTLSNVLINNNIMHSREDVKNMWKELEIDENVRGESLTLEQFGKIADYISEKK